MLLRSSPPCRAVVRRWPLRLWSAFVVVSLAAMATGPWSCVVQVSAPRFPQATVGSTSDSESTRFGPLVIVAECASCPDVICTAHGERQERTLGAITSRWWYPLRLWFNDVDTASLRAVRVETAAADADRVKGRAEFEWQWPLLGRLGHSSRNVTAAEAASFDSIAVVDFTPMLAWVGIGIVMVPLASLGVPLMWRRAEARAGMQHERNRAWTATAVLVAIGLGGWGAHRLTGSLLPTLSAACAMAGVCGALQLARRLRPGLVRVHGLFAGGLWVDYLREGDWECAAVAAAVFGVVLGLAHSRVFADSAPFAAAIVERRTPRRSWLRRASGPLEVDV